MVLSPNVWISEFENKVTRFFFMDPIRIKSILLIRQFIMTSEVLLMQLKTYFLFSTSYVLIISLHLQILYFGEFSNSFILNFKCKLSVIVKVGVVGWLGLH